MMYVSMTLTVDDALIEEPCDMPDDMVLAIVRLAREAAGRFDVDREGAKAAEYIKKKLDGIYGAHWHVVVGNGFGSEVIHEQHCFIYFVLNNRTYLIYKSGRC